MIWKRVTLKQKDSVISMCRQAISPCLGDVAVQSEGLCLVLSLSKASEWVTQPLRAQQIN